MLSPNDHISLLAHLSKADNLVAAEEYEIIISIASELGISSEEALAIIENPTKIPPLKELPSDDKFDALHNLIKVMKADGKIHRKEVKFAEKVALRLGYKPGVIADLSAYIFKDPAVNTKRAFLKSIADQNAIPLDEEDEL